MNRYQKMFKYASLSKEISLIPYVVIGDPSIEMSVKIIDVLIKSGANSLEIGIPFSDPLADGPIIQNANMRALSQHKSLLEYFKVFTYLRSKYIYIPIGILVYANLIYNYGINNFYLECKNSGVDSVLIADVPLEEINAFYAMANKHNIGSICICPPDSKDAFLKKLSLYAQDYIYVLSRTGVTGIKKNTQSLSQNFIHNIKKYNSIPLVQGFGISNTVQIKESISLGISGIICGSAIIKIIEKYLLQENKMMKEIQKFFNFLKSSTRLT